MSLTTLLSLCCFRALLFFVHHRYSFHEKQERELKYNKKAK